MNALTPEARRHGLVVLLTFVTGATDALSFLALGGAFSSVMTGNLVLLGMSGAASDWAQTLHVGIAVVFFITGVLAGAQVGGKRSETDSVWPWRVTVALIIEALLFTALLVIWMVSGADRNDTIAKVVLALATLALGIQTSAVRRFGISGLSSTYLTGTLTVMVEGFAARRPFSQQVPSLLVLTMLIVGAAAGTAALLLFPLVAPLVVLVPLIIIIIIAITQFGTAPTVRATR